jgi:hypothetical protein
MAVGGIAFLSPVHAGYYADLLGFERKSLKENRSLAALPRRDESVKVIEGNIHLRRDRQLTAASAGVSP